MILTAQEYAKGFIDFDAVLPDGTSVELWTTTADQPQENGSWEGPYLSPEGSKVLSLPKAFIKLKCGLHTNNPQETPVLTKVRWERDGLTFIWPGPYGFDGPPGPLGLGRDYGVSYRLVLKPKRAMWTESIIVITRHVRIRFCKGGIKVFDIKGFQDAKPTQDGKFSVEGELKEIELDEDVIEILATVPGNNTDQIKEAAKTQVESILGLLALCYGEQILGSPVYAEYCFSDIQGEQGHIPVPVKHLTEISIDNNSASFANEVITSLPESPTRSYINTPLRWYAAGINSQSPVDAFIAYFVSIESLTSGFFHSIDPKPIREAYSHLRDYFATAQPAIDVQLRASTLSAAANFSLPEKFNMYWENRFHGQTSQITEFTDLYNLRNDLIHGRIRTVTLNQVNASKNIIEKMLAQEFGIDNIIKDRQVGPTLLEFTLTYMLKPRT